MRRAFFFPWWGGGGGSRARCVVSSAVVAVCWCLVLERRPVGLRAHPPFLFSCVSPLIPNPCVCVCVCVFCAVAVRVCKKRAEETSASRRREDGSSSSLLFFSVSFFSHSSRRCGPGNTPHPRANKVLLVRRDVHDPHSRCLLLADARYERKQSRNASIDATKKTHKMDDPALEEIRARRMAQLMAGKGGGGGGAMTPEAQQQQVRRWGGGERFVLCFSSSPFFARPSAFPTSPAARLSRCLSHSARTILSPGRSPRRRGGAAGRHAGRRHGAGGPRPTCVFFSFLSFFPPFRLACTSLS